MPIPNGMTNPIKKASRVGSKNAQKYKGFFFITFSIKNPFLFMEM